MRGPQPRSVPSLHTWLDLLWETMWLILLLHPGQGGWVGEAVASSKKQGRVWGVGAVGASPVAVCLSPRDQTPLNVQRQLFGIYIFHNARLFDWHDLIFSS